MQEFATNWKEGKILLFDTFWGKNSTFQNNNIHCFTGRLS